jgi:hypothetical protein
VTRTTLNVHVRTSGLREAIQRCPAGMFAFGGGGTLSPSGISSNMDANTMTADGTGWEFSGIVVNTGDATQVTTQCAPDDGTTLQVSAGVAGQNGTLVTARAVCPGNMYALSGGAYLANPDGTEADGTIVWSDMETEGSWKVIGTAPVGGKVVALVRCTP